jgi:hypothetical protein
MLSFGPFGLYVRNLLNLFVQVMYLPSVRILFLWRMYQEFWIPFKIIAIDVHSIQWYIILQIFI